MFSRKVLFARLHDAVMAGVAALLALIARFGLEALPPHDLVILWVGVMVVVSAVVFHFFGLSRGMWRFASTIDLKRIVLACVAAILAFMIAMFLINRLEALPRSMPIITWFVMVVLLGGPRLAFRVLKDGGLASIHPHELAHSKYHNIMIIGGVTDADEVIRAYRLEGSARHKLHGIVDRTSARNGRLVRGIPVLGGFSELDDVLARLARTGVTIDAAILAGSGFNKLDLQDFSTVVGKWKLPLKRVSQLSPIRGEPDLENAQLEHLLGRAPVKLNVDGIEGLIRDQILLVTGAGGSIGSEIVRQIVEFYPKKIILLDNNEYLLYQIEQEIKQSYLNLPLRAAIADVRDKRRIRTLFSEERPSIVFHAAALKHVPMIEANVSEGTLTNVIGTCNVADAAVEAKANAMVLISSDKTVRPSSVMGASKRVAESYCQALDVNSDHTKFITVRFGNVLGSYGSVVPLFAGQISAGGPVTVTHLDMARYFMTITEATELVLQAAASRMDTGVPRGNISVLDMGEPIKIVDLARTMIALAGLRPDEDIKIEITGIRPGEKISEEIFDEREQIELSGVEGVHMVSVHIEPLPDICHLISELESAALAGEDAAVRMLLRRTGSRDAPASSEAVAADRAPANGPAVDTDKPAIHAQAGFG